MNKHLISKPGVVGTACPGRTVAALGAIGVALLHPMCVPAQGDESIDNEYRVTAFPYYSLGTNTAGFGCLGYVNNPVNTSGLEAPGRS